jgi:predicted MPP superfamily phosphohydrolase
MRRGRHYGLPRAVMEHLLGIVYAGDWPARVWGSVSGSEDVRIVRHARDLPQGAGPSCRVAFVSDIHVGPTTPTALLERAFALIEVSRPDILLLGGDYVYLRATSKRTERLSALVSSVTCPTKLAVMGNHDLWTDDAAIGAALEKAGARVLKNESVRLPAPWSDVAVIGLDDPWTGESDPKAAFAAVADAGFRLVLCHAPGGLLELAGHPFDLFVCGHTHGGQVATPWGPIVVAEGHLNRELSAGLGERQGREVFVSRGIGGVSIPFRTFAPPDILIVDLVRPACAGA